MSGNLYGVIMAGGGGTRLWPLSTAARPKQLLSLVGERSLFQVSVDRVAPVIPMDRLLVVTVQEQVEPLRRQVPTMPSSAFVVEPMPRGTASVIGLAALHLRRLDPEAVMAVLTADHFIRDESLFRKLVEAAASVAQRGELVTLGIRPTVAATGYGYLEQGELAGEAGGRKYYRVTAFREKPDEASAAGYLQGGKHFWNSGMFFWRVDRILEEIATQMPDLHARLEVIAGALGTDEENEVLEREWPQLASETIDFGVMEKAAQVVMVVADGLGWYDLGSWNRLFEVLVPDEAGNLFLAEETVALSTTDSLVVQAEDSPRLVATLGLDNIIVIDTGKALLVATREHAQDVRRLVERLRQDDKTKYL